MTPVTPSSGTVMEGAGDDVLLLFLRQLDEVHGVTGHPHRQVGVVLRVLHRVLEGRRVEDVDVGVVETGLHVVGGARGLHVGHALVEGLGGESSANSKAALSNPSIFCNTKLVI